jgi:hypothetical protein
LRRAQRLATAKLCLAAGLRKLVPWADREAIIAAVDAVAYRGTQLVRNRPFVLNGQIRNAAPRIEPIGRRERVGRAHVEAGLTCAAVIDLGFIDRKLERCEDGTEEQPRAVISRHQIGVLALPAETRARRERLLHHGRRIDEHLHVAAGIRHKPARDCLQLRLDELVIVVALRVDRDRAALALLKDRERIAVRPVIQAQHDDGARVRPEHMRVRAPRCRAGEPCHVAMRATRDKFLEPRLRLRVRMRRRDADRVKALRTGLRDQRRLDVGQKSRSA